MNITLPKTQELKTEIRHANLQLATWDTEKALGYSLSSSSYDNDLSREPLSYDGLKYNLKSLEISLDECYAKFVIWIAIYLPLCIGIPAFIVNFLLHITALLYIGWIVNLISLSCSLARYILQNSIAARKKQLVKPKVLTAVVANTKKKDPLCVCGEWHDHPTCYACWQQEKKKLYYGHRNIKYVK